MLKRLISIGLCFALTFAVLPMPFYAVTSPVTDLGIINIRSTKTAVDFYNKLLEREVPGAYKVTLEHGDVNLEQAMLTANKSHQSSAFYFKPESQFGAKDEPDLYYIEKADLVMKTSTDFEQFLATYAGQNFPDLRIKLCDYALNDGYNFTGSALQDGGYNVKDKALYGGDYLRTIKRYVFNDTPPVRTYTVSTDAELKTALTESVNAFYEKIVLVSPSNMPIQAIQQMLEQLNQTSPSPQFDFYSGFYVISQQNVITLQLHYDYPVETCKTLLAEGLSKASEIVATRVTPKMDDYTKAKLLHDYLLDTVNYDEYDYRFDLNDQRVHDFTGALLDNAAVCSGYASAYRMLLDAAGLENYYVSGSGQAYATVKKDHAWNIVKLGNRYYHADSTWNDQPAPILQHLYFLLSDAQLAVDHTWNRTLYPVCDDSSLEYFIMNGLVFDTPQTLNRFAEENLKNGTLNFGFKSNAMSSSQIKTEMTKLLNQLYPDGYSFTFTKYDNIYDYHILPKGSIMLPSADPIVRGLNLNDLSVQNGIFIAVGDKGQILHSTNGTKWRLLPKLTDKDLLSIAYGNRYYLTAGTSGTLLLSADGVRFNTYQSPTKQTIRRAVFLNGKFWLLGEKGFMASSPNGIKWTVSDTNTAYALNDMIFTSGKYLAVGQHGTLLTSADGKKWTLQKTGIGTELKSIAYGGGYYLTGGTSSTLLKSSDGKTWRQIRYDNPLLFNRILYAGGSFMAVGNEQRMLIQTDNRYTYISGRPLLNGITTSGKDVYVVGDKGQLYKGESGSIKVLWQVLDFLAQ